MPQPVSAPPRANLSLTVILDVLYLAGLAFCLARLLIGALFTRRLINAAAPIEADLGPQFYESSWISVPFTVGWLCPRILLPAAWRDWTPAKLEAVLAHERNHVRRRDWAMSVVAALNRSIYWFNPLAWWLERRLASLAEREVLMENGSSPPKPAEHDLPDGSAVGVRSGEPFQRSPIAAQAALRARTISQS